MDAPDNSDACFNFSGNPDLYGIGIRLGIYCSWYASLIANVLGHQRVDDLCDTNTLFMLANIVALFYNSTHQEITSVETFIVLSIFYGYFFSPWSLGGIRAGQICWSEIERTVNASYSTISIRWLWYFQLPSSIIPGRRKWHFRFLGGFSWMGTCFRYFIACMAAYYSVWFFFTGADKFRPNGCDSTIFLFGYHSLFGPARTFLKVLSVCLCVLLYIIYMPLIYGTFITLILVAIQEVRRERQALSRDQDSPGFNILLYNFINRLDFYAYRRPAATLSTFNPEREGLRVPEGKDMEIAISNGRLSSALIVFTNYCLAKHRLMFGLAGLITAIMTTLTIELTIRRNGIQDVDQLSKTSQLIPFVIGLASLLGVIRDVAVDTIDPNSMPDRWRLSNNRGTRTATAQNSTIIEYAEAEQGRTGSGEDIRSMDRRLSSNPPMTEAPDREDKKAMEVNEPNEVQ